MRLKLFSRTYCLRSALLLLLMSGGALGPLCGAASAQRVQQVEAERYTFVLLRVPLREALAALIEQTQISLVYSSNLITGRETYCRAVEQELETVLRCILKDTGLDYYRLSSGTYALRPSARMKPVYGNLTGQVFDQQTGQPLAYAHILLEQVGRGTVTNEAGRFAFASLLPGPYRVVATYIGYANGTDSVWVEPGTPQPLALALQAKPVLTAPIVINGLTQRRPYSTSNQQHPDDPGQLPASALTDAVASLNAIVGVRVGDALADVHVQGGDAGEHQFQLDGATVFAPIRIGGFLGPFSPFALRQITVRKAGFGVEHGSHLSGIIQAEHTLVPTKGRRLDVQVDPLSLNARFSGQTGRPAQRQLTWMLASRLGLWSAYGSAQLYEQLVQWSIPDFFLLDAPILWLDPASAPGETGDEKLLSLGSLLDETVEDDELDLNFLDLHAALRLHLGPLRSLRASAYYGSSTLRNTYTLGFDPEALGLTPALLDSLGEDAFGPTELQSSDRYTWRNLLGQMSYEWVLGRTAFASVGGWASQYTLEHPYGTSLDDVEDAPEDAAFDPDTLDFPNFPLSFESPIDRNQIRELGLKARLHFAAGDGHLLTGGLEGTHTRSTFSITLPWFAAGPASQRFDFDDLETWRWSAFLQDRLDLSDRTTLELGTRLTFLPDHASVYAEPRLSLRHDHTDAQGRQWAFRGAVGLYRQFLQQLDVATYQFDAIVPSYRFWVPIQKGQRPPKAYHASGSLLFAPSETWQVQAEAYYKHQPHLLVVDYATLIRRPDNTAAAIPAFLRGAQGYAYGLGLTVSRRTARTQITAQYERSEARRRTANRFAGRAVSVPWNAPHRLNLGVEYAVSPKVVLSLRWQQVIGRTWGFRQAYYDFFGPHPELQRFGSYDFLDPQNHRLPAFVQLDAGVTLNLPIRKANLQMRLFFLNVLGRRNVADWGLEFDPITEQTLRNERVLTPFLPVVTLRYSR